MDYELIISERADELTGRLVAYLLNNLNNPGAARHFLDELDAIYDRLINNPYQFPGSTDEYLFLRGYRSMVAQGPGSGPCASFRANKLSSLPPCGGQPTGLTGTEFAPTIVGLISS